MSGTLSRLAPALLVGLGLTVAPGMGWSPQAPAPAPTPTPAAQPAAAAAKPDEEAVRALFRAIDEAYNEKDPNALEALLLEEAALYDQDGLVASGRSGIIAHYAVSFTERPDARITGDLETIQFLTPDVARGEGAFEYVESPDATPAPGRFTLLAVRRDGRWQVAEIRDQPVPAPEPTSHYEYLKEVEWMIGDWVDESDDARVSSSIRWALNKNYIIRDYSIELSGEPAMTGMMVLGYDPQAGQLKSWVFDSEGGHGEASWTRVNDNQWVLKARGRTRDGSPTSATQVITILNRDVVRHSSLDRIIGGEVAPDIAEVIMVRKPPQPTPTPTPTPAPESRSAGASATP
jgi:uncharacterized protein (TIGR02246 family)